MLSMNFAQNFIYLQEELLTDKDIDFYHVIFVWLFLPSFLYQYHTIVRIILNILNPVIKTNKYSNPTSHNSIELITYEQL